MIIVGFTGHVFGRGMYLDSNGFDFIESWHLSQTRSLNPNAFFKQVNSLQMEL